MTEHIGSLKPDPKNARRHTPRNVGMIEENIQRYGFGRSVLIANDDTIIAGNATIEAAAAAGIERMRVVESRGDEVIAIKRVDIQSGTEEFHGLAVGDNRSGELADGWIGPVLASLNEEYPGLRDQFFFDDEWQTAIAAVPDFEPVGIEEQGRLDEKASVTCPHCGAVFTP